MITSSKEFSNLKKNIAAVKSLNAETAPLQIHSTHEIYLQKEQISIHSLMALKKNTNLHIFDLHKSSN